MNSRLLIDIYYENTHNGVDRSTHDDNVSIYDGIDYDSELEEIYSINRGTASI